MRNGQGRLGISVRSTFGKMKSVVAILTLLLPVASVGARSRFAPSSTLRAPRVGNIGNLSEVSKTLSCEFYFQFPTKGEVSPSRYVFVSQAH